MMAFGCDRPASALVGSKRGRLVALLTLLAIAVALERGGAFYSYDSSSSWSSLHPSWMKKNGTVGAGSSAVVDEERRDFLERVGGAAMKPPPTAKPGQPRFLFVVGIEGTGHHFLTKLLKVSPDAKVVLERGEQAHLKELKLSLYGALNRGYFYVHCNRMAGLGMSSASVEAKRTEVISRFKLLAGALTKNVTANPAAGDDDEDDGNKNGNEARGITVTLNAGGNYAEMASYPQDSDACRNVKYPNLDVLYDACDAAGVLCQHVYVYRDPYDVIQSTTVKRHFNKYPLQGMQLYITMLNVIYGQLARHSTRTVGCFGFYEQNVSAAEVWDPIRQMFGWDDPEEFQNVLREIYAPPTEGQADHDEKQFRPFMQSMVQSHESVIDLCRRQVYDNVRNGLTPYSR